ncbi:MAG: Fic family protein [Alphaproteobacteria bacterium]|nr:Fic family protein [Alphaproteobacteria bacterium]
MLGINKIKITNSVLRRIAEIDEFKGLWRGLERHTTGLQLLGDVADYGANFSQTLGPLENRPITVDVLCLLNGAELRQKSASSLRYEEITLEIVGDEGFIAALDVAEAALAGPLLERLVQWVNEALAARELHPLLVSAMFMSIFLQIAPFKAGNMGVARFVVMLILLKSGYIYVPYASLAPLMAARAEAVYGALKHNQASLEQAAPDWTLWLDFFLELLCAQKDILQARLYGKGDELKNLPALSARIMTLFKHHQRLQMKDIELLTYGRRATLKLRLAELVKNGYLVRHGSGRATWYALI